MSRRLRAALMIQWLPAWLLVQALAGAGAVAAIVPACAAVLAFDLALVALGYACVQRFDSRRTGLRCGLGEILALFVLFCIIQPFERIWMGPEALGRIEGGRYPVLLVHGYLCNRGMWWRVRRRLRARQTLVATVDLEPPLGNLDALAQCLADRIERLLFETGAERIVLVTHSMGGLVGRAYLRRHGHARIARLLMLAAPHHGTRTARLACGQNARQMRIGSRWLDELNAQPLPAVPLTNLWTVDDELVSPPDSARLAGTSEIVLDGIGHLAMVFSARVLAHIEDAVARE